MKNQFQHLGQALFNELKNTEELNLTLNAEDNTYLRFNQSKVRQNTFVSQKLMSLNFQNKGRKVAFDVMLTGDLNEDLGLTKSLLQRARQEIEVLPEDPFVTAFENRGTSDKNHSGKILDSETAISNIAEATQGCDFAGFYAGGTSVKANQNSKGQSHWFSTESFFVDYSLYTKNVDGENKAVKGVYADSQWQQSQFANQLQTSKNQLSLLTKKSKSLGAGEYRTYLAPGAIAEIVGMLSWNALSYSAMKKGNCAFTKLYEKQKTLSPLFSLKENFDLGLTPQFNSLGEMAPDILPLIEKGELKNMLVSSRAEKEYGVKSNGSDFGGWGFEFLRSPEIAPGQLAEADALKALGTGLYLGNLHYLNWSDPPNARFTGMTRYACFWVENGEIVGPIKDMRFDDSLFRVFGSELEAVTKEQHIDPAISTYFQREIGGKKIPGMLLNKLSITL